MLAGVWTWVRLPPAPLLIGETLLNQRFLFLSLVFLGILLRKKDTTKESQTDPKKAPLFKKR